MRFFIINADEYLVDGLDEKYQKLLQPFGLKKDKDNHGKDIFTIELKHYKDLGKIMELTGKDIIIEHTSYKYGDRYDKLVIYDAHLD